MLFACEIADEKRLFGSRKDRSCRPKGVFSHGERAGVAVPEDVKGVAACAFSAICSWCKVLKNDYKYLQKDGLSTACMDGWT